MEFYRAISPAGASYYQLQKTSYTSSEVFHGLQDLLLYFQQPLLLLGDGASIPQSQVKKTWLRTHKFDGRVPLARLPAYRPQLNAASPVWAWLKGGQLKNVCGKTLEELTQVVQKAVEKLPANPAIIQKFFEPPEVALLLIINSRPPYGIFNAIKYLRLFFAGQVKYLGPLRDKPGFIYIVNHNSVDVGAHGQYTAAILNRYKEEQIDYVPSSIFKTPKELSTVSAKDKVVKGSLAKTVIDWLKYLDVAESVETYDRGFGYELKVILPGITKPLDLVHVGTRVSQVLPLLVMCLLAPTDSTLIIEQPELHLHPAIQTRLGDFFLAMALSGKQCLIETHSEYLINRLRLRLALAQDDSLNALLKTYFVEKTGLESSFREVSVNEYGAINDWPEGFFDQSQAEAEAIIMASVSKRQARRRGKSNA